MQSISYSYQIYVNYISVFFSVSHYIIGTLSTHYLLYHFYSEKLSISFLQIFFLCYNGNKYIYSLTTVAQFIALNVNKKRYQYTV